MQPKYKIGLVVFITVLALSVFIWSYFKKGEDTAKKDKMEDLADASNETPTSDEETAANNEKANDEATLAVMPDSYTEDEVLTKSIPAPTTSATPLISIDIPKYSVERRAFDYTMNYNGQLVKGVYADPLLKDRKYSGGAIELLNEYKNGVYFKVSVSSHVPSKPTRILNTGVQAEANLQVLSSKKNKMSGKPSSVRIDTLATEQKEQIPQKVVANSVMLVISKGEQVLRWKMVDLTTGTIYVGIPNSPHEGAAYIEGDLSKEVHYLD
jgi:hypothetical protein